VVLDRSDGYAKLSCDQKLSIKEGPLHLEGLLFRRERNDPESKRRARKGERSKNGERIDGVG